MDSELVFILLSALDISRLYSRQHDKIYLYLQNLFDCK